MDFTDFGQPVDLELPDPNSVVDLETIFDFTTTDATETDFGTSWVTTDANGEPLDVYVGGVVTGPGETTP